MRAIIGGIVLNWFGSLNWRYRFIVIATSVNVFMTVLIYFAVPSATDISHFWGSVFVSWLAGVALFVFLGVIVTIISIFDPHDEPLDARIKILFAGRHGADVGFAVDQVKHALQPFVERADIKMVIVEYESQSRLYKVNHTTKSLIRALLPDLVTRLESQVGIRSVAPAPLDRQPNTVEFVRVDGEEIYSGDQFLEGITYPITVSLAPEKPSTIEYRAVYWSEVAREPHRHIPARYVRLLQLSVENRLGSDLLLSFSLKSGAPQSITLRPQEIKVFEPILNLAEGKIGYEMNIDIVSGAPEDGRPHPST